METASHTTFPPESPFGERWCGAVRLTGELYRQPFGTPVPISELHVFNCPLKREGIGPSDQNVKTSKTSKRGILTIYAKDQKPKFYFFSCLVFMASLVLHQSCSLTKHTTLAYWVGDIPEKEFQQVLEMNWTRDEKGKLVPPKDVDEEMRELLKELGLD